MRRVRRDAYREDIGQHSWTTVRELRADLDRLALTRASRFLDLGCGPGGPLTFVLESAGCTGVGLDISATAVGAARERARSLNLDRLATVHQADLDDPLPFDARTFDAAMAADVVVHVADRAALFLEVARVLGPGGCFLFTDAGVKMGPLSDEEIESRSLHERTELVPPGFNEHALADAGFRLIETEDRTDSVLETAEGRLAARLAHREALERLETAAGFERQQRYLATTIELARRRALVRIMYFSRTDGA